MNRYIDEYLHCIEKNNARDEWLVAKKRIYKENQALIEAISSKTDPAIYGVTTLVGHMDNQKVKQEKVDDFQYNFYFQVDYV